MRTFRLFLTGIIFLSCLCSCNGGMDKKNSQGGDTLALIYADHITIIKYRDFTKVELADPWNKGRILHTYLLVDREKEVPEHLPEGTVVRTPLQNSVVSTSVHCGLLMQMGRQDAIGGVCDVQYIHLPWIQDRCKTKKIADCGSGLQPTLETIINLQPDAIFLSPFQNSGGYGRLEELGIPIIETADYMETSALGRAEWMRFYGLLFGAEQQTDSIYDLVLKNYDALCKMAKRSSRRPKVVMDKLTGPVWYVPGGKSTVGRLISNAVANYPWAADDHSGSLSLPFESVLNEGGNADVWLFRYNSPQPMTRQVLLSEKAGYQQFRAFQTGELYGCNTATSTFYEDTPFHPDLLLRDLITILHPDLHLGDPKYFIKVQQ